MWPALRASLLCTVRAPPRTSVEPAARESSAVRSRLSGSGGVDRSRNGWSATLPFRLLVRLKAIYRLFECPQRLLKLRVDRSRPLK
jgi:hypothetical protein